MSWSNHVLQARPNYDQTVTLPETEPPEIKKFAHGIYTSIRTKFHSSTEDPYFYLDPWLIIGPKGQLTIDD